MNKPSRYDQLSPAHKNLLKERSRTIATHESLNSYLGPKKNSPYFMKALEQIRLQTADWKTQNYFLDAFVKWSNGAEKSSARTITTGANLFVKGLGLYINKTNQANIAISQIDAKFLKQFYGWIGSQTTISGCKRSPETIRKQAGFARAILVIIQNDEQLAGVIAKDLVFPTNPHKGSRNPTKPTPIVDDHIWQQIILACKREISEIVGHVLTGTEILRGSEIEPDNRRRGRGKYREYGAALWEVARSYPDYIPALAEIKKQNRELAEAIQYIHRKESITRPFYPRAEDIFPFIVLQSIYSLANTGPLRALKWSNTKLIEVLKVMRVQYTFDKQRGHYSYDRSFALTPDDLFSPYELHLFLKEWTSSIRPRAGIFKDHIYIFQTRKKKVRGFLTGKEVGDDSDSTWNSVCKTFYDKHGLPKTTVGMLRITGLDIIRERSNDDIRAVSAAGGQKAAATIDLHYTGPGARRRRNESLGEIMIAKERWAKTGGRRDIRTEPEYTDVGAATPGWNCLDPFDSPIPGERKRTSCQAFGQCPACPLTSINLTSAYSLARALQLAEEIKQAQFYLDLGRWRAVFEPVLEALKQKWLPSFTDKEVILSASKTNLSPIGKLE